MARTNLTEITKNKIGTGILVENDGYISMTEGNNKHILEEARKINESTEGGEFYCPYPFIVHAVFQKYGGILPDSFSISAKEQGEIYKFPHLSF